MAPPGSEASLTTWTPPLPPRPGEYTCRGRRTRARRARPPSAPECCVVGAARHHEHRARRRRGLGDRRRRPGFCRREAVRQIAPSSIAPSMIESSVGVAAAVGGSPRPRKIASCCAEVSVPVMRASPNTACQGRSVTGRAAPDAAVSSHPRWRNPPRWDRRDRRARDDGSRSLVRTGSHRRMPGYAFSTGTCSSVTQWGPGSWPSASRYTSRQGPVMR